MLLAVDIGNTNISIGIFKDKRLLKHYFIPTKQKNYFSGFKRIVDKYKVNDALICSVVPKVTSMAARDLKRLTGKQPYIIGKEIEVPIKNCYRNPKEAGQDRLVNAYAGIKLYGAPLIIVDFGTAITFDLVSKKKEYLGGMILPGLSVSLEALNQGTALLPKIKLQAPKEFIGRDTKNSMLSGIIYGFAALADALIRKIKKEIGKRAKVVGTGGNIKMISEFCASIDKIDPLLTLKGINLLLKKS